MKARLFSKGRAYISEQKCPNNRSFSTNEVVESSSNRVVAPAPVMPAAQLSTSRPDLPPSDVFRGIHIDTTSYCLQGYQREIDRKNDLIAKQRQTIKKLRDSAARMTDLLKSQSELVLTAQQQNGDCVVRIFRCVF